MFYFEIAGFVVCFIVSLSSFFFNTFSPFLVLMCFLGCRAFSFCFSDSSGRASGEQLGLEEPGATDPGGTSTGSEKGRGRAVEAWDHEKVDHWVAKKGKKTHKH